VKMTADSDVEWMFPTMVAGVSHCNKDRKSRQKIIRDSCRAGQRVRLIPEPDNRYDENAIGVWTEYGEQTGYLNADVARIAYDKHQVDSLVAEIIGVRGGDDGHHYGVTLRLGVKKENKAAAGTA
jgi:hypothetical protein